MLVLQAVLTHHHVCEADASAFQNGRLRCVHALHPPPKPGTLLSEVTDHLAAHDAEVAVHLPHEQSVEAEELVGQSLVAGLGHREQVGRSA